MIFFGILILLTSFGSPTLAGADLRKLGPVPQSPVSQSEDTANRAYSEAKSLLNKYKWDEAATAFRSLLRNNPKSLPVVLGLSEALIYSNQREEALTLMSQAMNWTSLPQHLLLVQRIRVSSRLFLTNKSFEIYQDGLNLLIGKKYRNAKEKFEKTLMTEPANVEILIRLGQSLVFDNDFDNAIERLKYAKKLNPYEPEIKLWLGRALQQRGAARDALVELREANSELHGSEIASVWLSEVLSSLGQTVSAIRLLERDVRVSPFHILSMINLAKFRLQSARPDAKELWSARKELQLAMSRLDQKEASNSPRFESELSLDLSRPTYEIKGEIQRLMQVVQGRLDQLQ